MKGRNQKSEVRGQKPSLTFVDGGIDAGLLMLVATTSPDRCWTLKEIAYVCGCSSQNINYIEQCARRKLSSATRLKELVAA